MEFGEDLADRIVDEEGPRVLHWLIRGCIARREEGLNPPEAVIAQTTQYKDTQDVLEQWLNEECEFAAITKLDYGDTGYDTTRRELYAAWKVWCRGGDFDYGSEKSFKVSMDTRTRAFSFEGRLVGPREGRKRGYRGIRLKNSVTGGFDV